MRVVDDDCRLFSGTARRKTPAASYSTCPRGGRAAWNGSRRSQRTLGGNPERGKHGHQNARDEGGVNGHQALDAAAPVSLVDGVPVGVQLISGRYQEELLLAAGEVIEARQPLATPIEPRF